MHKIKEKISMKKLKRVLALAMAVILSVPTLSTGTGTIPVKAADDSIELVVSNESAKYAGYETRKMSAGGNYAYCITPSKKTPAAGTYTKHYDVATYMKTPGDETAAENLRHIAYYCWGAPGFNAGNFPATWYDGSAMDDDKYIALSHIILADAASYEGGEAMHGCNSSFKNWAYQNVLGFNTAGELINENAPRFKLTWQPVPDSFKIFVLETGKTQNILGYEYTPTGTVSLSKTSANTGITSGNSCYSLAGAVYGIYSDAGCSAQVTTLTTDAGGNAAAVSLNAGTYYYKELTAPAGYALDSSVQSFTVTAGQNTALSVSDTPTNDPAMITLNKVDSETGDMVQGGASLAGAQFTVNYYDGYYNNSNLPANPTRSWIIQTKEITTKGGNKVYRAVLSNDYFVAGDALYSASGINTLPLGTISIEETKAPEGYSLEGAYLQVGGTGTKITGKYVAQITQNGNLAQLKGGNTFKVSDKIKRGDFKLTKIDTDNQNRMSDIPFRVTCKGTGESHIIKTDENGYFSSESSWNAHSKNTNGGGAYDGLWFSSADGSAKVDDSVGAMPYGDYTLEELSCENNRGKILYKGEFSIRRDKVTVDIGTIENHSEPTPVITTQASDAKTQYQIIKPSADTDIVDKVTITDTMAGRDYTITGTLMDKDTGEAVMVNGNPVTASQTFTSDGTKKVLDMHFKFDSSALGGKTVVVCEKLTYGDYVAATEEDMENKDQTIYFPEIHTTATDSETADHLTLADSRAVITDTVTYTNLLKGETYTLSGVLMDKETGKELLVDGEPVTQEMAFTAGRASGTKKLKFEFDTTGLAGKSFVVYETLTLEDVEVAEHKDINDEGQTIHIPAAQTTATDDSSKINVSEAKKEVSVTDTVAYRNLVPGEKYTVTGTAIDKTTGETLKDDAGKDVTAKASFKAEKANGTVDVEFVFDGSSLAGKTVVMYENIYYNNKLVGVHADISDEAQIIYVPSVKTAATDTKTETKLTYAEKDIKITDTVEYTNLIPGKTYKVTGTAMDKKTGKVIKDADGKAVTSEAEITPETADGKVDVDFIFDGSNLAGKTIVMFEEIRYENRLVGVHADINDEAQTIYVPAIATEALDEVTGIHLSNAGDDVKVKDTVTYKNLIPGLTYRVAGTVMDKDSKKPLQNDGRDITAEAVFTPETADGTVDVEFTFSAKEFAGKTMVLFEKLYLVKNADNADANPDDTSNKDKTPDDTQKASESENTQNKTDNTSNKVEVDNEDNNPADNSEVKEVLIAVHEDYSDENQTICVPQIKTTAKDAKSGTSMFYAEKNAKIVDTVSYRNLVPGKKYKVVGTAVDKSNGAPVIANGNNVTAEAEFVAKEATGKVDVVFTFDASLLAGRTIVMFEDVYYENNLIATHADITDEEQTLYVPKIGTTAIDGERKDHSSTADSSVTIVDSVAYQNLVQGQTYRVTGKLMDKATGKALVIDGKEVTAVTEFTAAGTEGVVDVTFRFNGKGMTGKQLVVFEQLDVVTADGAYAIASHNDINDATQTITMIAPPKPKTGDYMSVVMYVLAGIAGIMAVICSFFRKKAVSKKKH